MGLCRTNPGVNDRRFFKVNHFVATEMKITLSVLVPFCFFLAFVDTCFNIGSDLLRNIFILPFKSGWRRCYMESLIRSELKILFFYIILLEKTKKKNWFHSTQNYFPIFSKLKKTNPLISQLSSTSPPRLRQNVSKKAFEGIITLQLLGRVGLGEEIKRHNLSPYTVK